MVNGIKWEVTIRALSRIIGGVFQAEITPNRIIVHIMENSRPLAFVIEDDKNLSLAFGEALTEANYQVEIIRDGQQAMHRLETTVPKTIILDLHIPYISGVEILKHIRATERLTRIKVIVTTADDRKAEELRELADLVLIKPVGFLQLKEMAVRLHPANSGDSPA